MRGGEGHIAFSLKYLHDYVNDKDGLFSIGVRSPSGPARFIYQGRSDMVLMPMFVKDEQPAQEPEAGPEPPDSSDPDEAA